MYVVFLLCDDLDFCAVFPRNVRVHIHAFS